ncbi:MAG: hypothetical protein ACM3U1_10740 [Chloroflexota bacterium]
MRIFCKILLGFSIVATIFSPCLAYQYSSSGKKFIFALPPNENPAAGIDVIACRIIVSSAKRANVTIQTPTGEVINREMQPSTSFEYSYPLKQFEKSEVYETFKAVKKTFEIVADDSISVYVLSIKDYSADGFSAIPVDSWDKEYYHVGYYDYATGKGALFPRGGGFLVLAAEDNTRVTIEVPPSLVSMDYLVDGKGKPRKIEATLQKGETYSVRSEGSHQWTDLSGAHITSDKPIGLISYHLRTVLPTEIDNISFGRNHLCEALPPVRAWGKKFYSLEFNRRGGGDYFRLLASKNNTNWTCKYYDKITGALLGELSGTLDAGRFYEFNQRPGADPVNWFSIRGVAVWETSEPSLLVQYSYSSDWDNKRPKDPNDHSGNSFDPSMSLVMPAELYTQNGVLRSTGFPFSDNWLNLIIVGDPNDPDETAVKSLSLNGKPLYQVYPKLLSQRIPTTDLYWAHVRVDTGTHVLTGRAYFSGTLYGFAVENFYSYPIWASQSPIPVVRQVDSIPPLFFTTADCGYFDIVVTDSIAGGGAFQSGIKKIALVAGAQNLKLFFPQEATEWIYSAPQATASLRAEVEDRSLPASGFIAAVDSFGNTSLSKLEYDPADRYKINLKLVPSETNPEPGRFVEFALLAETGAVKPPLNKLSLKIAYPAEHLFLYRDTLNAFNDGNDRFSIGVHDGAQYDTLIVNSRPPYVNILDTAAGATKLFGINMMRLLPLSPEPAVVSVVDPMTNLDDCVDITTEPAAVDYEVCGKELRSVVFGEPYAFEANSSRGAIDVKFTVPFDQPAEIEIYSSSGESVLEKYIAAAPRGASAATLDASAFSAGVYFIVFRSGPYVAARRALIY